MLRATAPFAAAAAALSGLAAWREGAANRWLAEGRRHLLAAFAADEVQRGVLLALALGVPVAALSLVLLRGAPRAAAALAWGAQAAWLRLIVESPAAWRVARVRGDLTLPNLFWRLLRGKDGPSPALWQALAAGAVVGVAAAVLAGPRARGRKASRAAAALLALALVAAAGTEALERATLVPAGNGRPVVMLTFDSTRADHLSCYGYGRETTPRIDAFARDAVLFERAYSNHNWTRPSYMSALTGRQGWEINVGRLRPETLLLAEVLRDAGWATRALVQNPNLDASFRLDQGFDRYLQFVEDARPSEVARWAVRAIDELAGGPFFLFVHVEQPHWPYRYDGPFVAGRYDAAAPPVDPGTVEGLLARHEVERFRADEPGAGERLAFLVDLYDGDLADADAGFGEIVAHLEARGLLRESLVLFFSDHGDELFDRGDFGHAHRNVHQDVTRVPLVARFPDALGVPPGRSDAPVQNLDLFPTVLDALGLPPVPELRGTSLLAVLEGGGGPRAILSSFDGLLAVRTRDLALFRDFERGGEPVLYDVSRDPGELVPVAEPEAAPGYRELADLAEWWAAECWPDARGSSADVSRDVDPELERRLRDLGYL